MAWVYMPEHYKSLVEGFGVCALLHLPVAHEVVKKMKYLPKESGVTLESVLKNRNAYGWCPIRLQCVSFRIGDSGNSTVIPTKNIKPGILYIPTLFEFDVIDAFYFVEVLRPDTTGDVRKNNSRLTLVFVRVPRERDTALTTSRVAAFIRRMKECMDGWEQLTNEIASRCFICGTQVTLRSIGDRRARWPLERQEGSILKPTPFGKTWSSSRWSLEMCWLTRW
ncbi:hypothetical protein TRVL_08009 [Trypanosoma vivax]|nr:hypothetical protein TRVL_08009 [Trypanosoma vivax]